MIAWSTVSNVLRCLGSVLAAYIACTQLNADDYTASPFDVFSEASQTDAISEVQKSMDRVLGSASIRKRVIADIVTETDAFFKTLPKNQYGNLGNKAAKHLVHNFLNSHRGWVLKGLEHHGMRKAALNAIHEVGLLRLEAPEVRHALRENRLRGLSHAEVSSLIAVLEQLVLSDIRRLLVRVFELKELDPSGSLQKRKIPCVLAGFAALLIKGSSGLDANVDGAPMEGIASDPVKCRAVDSGTKSFVLDMLEASTFGKSGYHNMHEKKLVKFEHVWDVGKQIAYKLGLVQNGRCEDLRAIMRRADRNNLGRIGLANFCAHRREHNMSTDISMSGLRQAGVVDEDTEGQIQVLTANYLNGPASCFPSFKHFSFCCANKCAGVQQEIEKGIGSSMAEPKALLRLVQETTSASHIGINGQLPWELENKIFDIAKNHGGYVPLHGRLFVQWLHFAFPDTCSYPHDHQAGRRAWNNEESGAFPERNDDVQDVCSDVGDDEFAIQPFLSQWSETELLPLEDETTVAQDGFSSIFREHSLRRVRPVVCILLILGALHSCGKMAHGCYLWAKRNKFRFSKTSVRRLLDCSSILRLTKGQSYRQRVYQKLAEPTPSGRRGSKTQNKVLPKGRQEFQARESPTRDTSVLAKQLSASAKTTASETIGDFEGVCSAADDQNTDQDCAMPAFTPGIQFEVGTLKSDPGPRKKENKLDDSELRVGVAKRDSHVLCAEDRVHDLDVVEEKKRLEKKVNLGDGDESPGKSTKNVSPITDLVRMANAEAAKRRQEVMNARELENRAKLDPWKAKKECAMAEREKKKGNRHRKSEPDVMDAPLPTEINRRFKLKRKNVVGTQLREDAAITVLLDTPGSASKVEDGSPKNQINHSPSPVGSFKMGAETSMSDVTESPSREGTHAVKDAWLVTIQKPGGAENEPEVTKVQTGHSLITVPDFVEVQLPDKKTGNMFDTANVQILTNNTADSPQAAGSGSKYFLHTDTANQHVQRSLSHRDTRLEMHESALTTALLSAEYLLPDVVEKPASEPIHEIKHTWRIKLEQGPREHEQKFGEVCQGHPLAANPGVSDVQCDAHANESTHAVKDTWLIPIEKSSKATTKPEPNEVHYPVEVQLPSTEELSASMTADNHLEVGLATIMKPSSSPSVVTAETPMVDVIESLASEGTHAVKDAWLISTQNQVETENAPDPDVAEAETVPIAEVPLHGFASLSATVDALPRRRKPGAGSQSPYHYDVDIVQESLGKIDSFAVNVAFAEHPNRSGGSPNNSRGELVAKQSAVSFARSFSDDGRAEAGGWVKKNEEPLESAVENAMANAGAHEPHAPQQGKEKRRDGPEAGLISKQAALDLQRQSEETSMDLVIAQAREALAREERETTLRKKRNLARHPPRVVAVSDILRIVGILKASFLKGPDARQADDKNDKDAIARKTTDSCGISSPVDSTGSTTSVLSDTIGSDIGLDSGPEKVPIPCFAKAFGLSPDRSPKRPPPKAIQEKHIDSPLDEWLPLAPVKAFPPNIIPLKAAPKKAAPPKLKAAPPLKITCVPLTAQEKVIPLKALPTQKS